MESLNPPSWIITTFAFIFGALWGSFANVCIHRIPAGVSVVWPPSRCPACLSPVRAWDNVPVLSWLLLSARCRDCKSAISSRYPLVEFISAVLSAVIAYGSTNLFSYLVFFGLTLSLVILSFIDIDEWYLPDVIIYPGIICGLLISLLGPVSPAGMQTTIHDSLLGLLIGGGSFFIIGLVFKLVARKEGLGMGDTKLMAMIGSFLGWKAILPVIFLSAFQGTIVGLILLYMKGKRGTVFGTDPKTIGGDFTITSHHVPYGPFISLGAIEWMLFGTGMLKIFQQ